MSEWKRIKLSECCQSIADGDHQAPPKAETGIPFVTISNITSTNQFDFSNTLHVPREYYDGLDDKRKVKKNDILYSVVGSFGIPIFMKEDKEFVFQRHIAILRPNEKYVVPHFLFYTMLTRDFYAKADAAAIGAAQRTISLTSLRNMEIDIPEKSVQEKIVGILSAYDDLIENNQLQIKPLEEAAQRLYKEWFVDLHFPGHEDVEIVDGVPEGWEKKKIVELSSVLRRGISPAYNDEGKYTVINQKCIRSSIMSLDEARRQEKEYPTEINLQDADTVICSTGTGTLGRVGQVYGDYPLTTIDSHVTLVRANQYENLLYHSIKANQDYLMGMGRGSTNQQELYRNVIEETDVLWPSSDIASQFEKIALSIHKMITALDKKISCAIEARDRLLPKLMSGEIEL